MYMALLVWKGETGFNAEGLRRFISFRYQRNTTKQEESTIPKRGYLGAHYTSLQPYFQLL